MIGTYDLRRKNIQHLKNIDSAELEEILLGSLGSRYKLSQPAAQKVTLYFYFEKLTLWPRTLGDWKKYGDGVQYVSLSYFNSLPSYLKTGDELHYVKTPEFEEPFATCTYNAGEKNCKVTLLHNPFRVVPDSYNTCSTSNSSCKLEPETDIELFIDISPRYDSNNIYFIDYPGGRGVPETGFVTRNANVPTVYAWINNLNGSSGISYNVGEFVK